MIDIVDEKPIDYRTVTCDDDYIQTTAHQRVNFHMSFGGDRLTNCWRFYLENDLAEDYSSLFIASIKNGGPGNKWFEIYVIIR